MAHEIVPADIAAAIEHFALSVRCGEALSGQPQSDKVLAMARARLDAAILHHLRAADEMKAALERIEAGT